MKLKALAAVAAATPLMVACGSSVEKAETFKLNAAGATFPAPLYNSWFQNFNKETGNQVNYQAVGSGAGVRQYTACLLYTSPSPRDLSTSRMPSSA